MTRVGLFEECLFSRGLNVGWIKFAKSEADDDDLLVVKKKKKKEESKLKQLSWNVLKSGNNKWLI